MDWSWNYSALPDASQIKWSESRDVVEVPGGAEWKIRKLEEEYPEYCWKYCGTFPLAQYHFKMASGDNCRDVPRLPMFYATIPHHVSPFELSIQPKFLEKARRSLLLQMAEEYDQNITQNFTDSQMFTPVACACYVNSKWCRGRINKLCGNSCVLVELVDYGTEVFVNPSELRPLLRKFGRMPPLALKCRLKDVYINDLNTSKVEEFHRIIEDCKGVVRVELLTASEPFLINIFHPTLEDENLGQMFYRAAENEGHEQAKQRRWADHLRRENCEDDECFEISEDYGVHNEQNSEPLYITRFERSPKSNHAGFGQLIVGHVENSRLIYLHTEWMLRRRDEIERSFGAKWSELLTLPAAWMEVDAVCAIRVEDSFHRASISNISSDVLELFLVDYGRFIEVNRAAADLRALPYTNLFAEAPLIVVTSVDNKSTFPHVSFTSALKQFLPPGTRVQFQRDMKYKRVPERGRITLANTSVDVVCHVSKTLRETRINVECREVVPFQGNMFFQEHLHSDTSYTYRLHCPTPLHSFVENWRLHHCEAEDSYDVMVLRLLLENANNFVTIKFQL
ncbi:hypothetical protein Q1695_006739 [Nippostrongylus brasiliensis]|nr:hypothetical protein Q1695_006739 [Nippostrongylus brasiliensis]